MDAALVFFSSYGQSGLFLGGGFVLFRYLLTRHDQLSSANLSELKAQVRELKRRAMRAELVVRAYARAGYPVPQDEVRTELRMAEELYDLFPEFDNR